jgi:tetratricopeptide (TPR) repeat protein
MSARTTTTIALLAAALGCAEAPPRPAERPPSAGKPAASPAARASAPAAPAAPAAKSATVRNGGASASAPAPGAAPAGAAAAPGAEPALPAKAQRLFEEAVRAKEDQKKLKVPPDWPYLERKWRAVLDAADVAEARYNLGVALEGQGKLGEARAEYERARALKPTLRQASVNLGVLLEKQGDPAGASAVYAQCVRDFPEDAVARARLAALYRESGQLDEAWRLAREALVREPRTVGAYRVLARVALQKNELDLAKLIALRAQKLDDQDPELPWVVGLVLARQGDDAGAQVQFRKALALREGFLPARYALLEGAVKKQAWGTVAEHAAAILKIEPGNAGVQLAHGLALRYTGKPDEALAAYDRAEKASNDRLPETHLARGVLLARVKSECEPALQELKLYTARIGPLLPEGSQVTKLQRECEAQLEEAHKAAEAAKQMQAEAARQAAVKAAKDGKGTSGEPSKEPPVEKVPAPGPAPGGTPPPSPPR